MTIALVACAVAVGCASKPAPSPAGEDAGADAGTDKGAGSDAGTDTDTDADADMGVGAAAPRLVPPSVVASPLLTPPSAPWREPRCPPEMVRVARRFCVDRFEATLLDKASGLPISSFYPPTKRLAESSWRTWSKLRLELGSAEARRMDLPLLPEWQRQRDFEPRAISKSGVLPQGYMSGELAALACKNAGKRLCTLDEWRTACRGERDETFPYGPTYAQGRCNIFREHHPAGVLHNDVTIGHGDPRLNLVAVDGAPLLRRAGETATCASAWDGDAIVDMVGNLDEWVDDPEGTFAGGFYARATKDGCMARITTHSFDYFDYSTGARCCADLRASAPPP